MRYSYEAVFDYSAQDGCWYVDFPAFGGEAYADGGTMADAISNASEVLELTLCAYLDDGIPLPAATFHEPPLSVISVDVSDEDIARSRCMSVGDAADELGVTPGRVSQLLSSGQLEPYMYGGTRLVTIASVMSRKASKPPAHRPSKAARAAVTA